jgi:cAMP-dependent protein kinase regulator
VARIAEGGSVGELALTDGKPRFCTVKALSRVHLLCLSRNDFEKAKNETKRKRTSNLVTFVKKIPLFYNLTRTYLSKLCLKFEFININRDYILFKEGDIADKVFIVKSGEFIVTKKLP